MFIMEDRENWYLIFSFSIAVILFDICSFLFYQVDSFFCTAYPQVGLPILEEHINCIGGEGVVHVVVVLIVFNGERLPGGACDVQYTEPVCTYP